jgi:recombination protein RecT
MAENMMTKTEKPKNVAMALQIPTISKRIEDMMGKRAPQFCSALIQVSKQSHLADCEPMSIIGSAMTAAAMDLSIDPNLGFAHIVPYNNRDGKVAQFQMGYKGFIQLALRTGQYAQMNDFKVNKEAFISFSPV